MSDVTASYCKCGEKLNLEWSYCPMCGTKVDNTVTVWECLKCETLFEANGQPYLHGILCPECREKGYSIVGVLKKILVNRSIFVVKGDENVEK